MARGGGKRWVLVCLSFPEMCCCGVYGIRGTTSLHNRCYLFAFFRLAKASTKCVGREARYIRSAPSPFARVWRSTPAQPRLKNAKKITPVLQAKELNSEIRYRVSQNFPLAIERDSARAGSTIEDCMLSYKSDFILHNPTLHVPFYDQFQSN